MTVLRMPTGADVRIFNPQQGEWLARTCGRGAGRIDALEALTLLRPPPLTRSPMGRVIAAPARDGEFIAVAEDVVPGPWLLFAPLKQHSGRVQWLLEKAVELGVETMIPIVTDYVQLGSSSGVHKLSNPSSLAATPDRTYGVPCCALTLTEAIVSSQFELQYKDKAQRWIVGAVEQSERLTIPSLLPPMSLAHALTLLGAHTPSAATMSSNQIEGAESSAPHRKGIPKIAQATGGGGVVTPAHPTVFTVIVADEEAPASSSLLSALANLQSHSHSQGGLLASHTRVAALVVGPEGGWSSSERAVFQAGEAAVGSSHVSSCIRRVSLGSNVLRSETAAICMLAVYNALTR